MTVSIVIPVYNAEKYIAECVKSAINQSFKEIEIIAIDDGSSDRSLEILNQYADRVKIISKENGGTATALNAGIKVMTGDWFKWLSADDVLYPNAIEEFIIEAENLEDKKNTILYSNYDIIDSEGNKIDQFIEPNYNNLSKFEFNVILLDHFVGNGSTSLIHKTALDDYGYFDENIGYKEDYELWLRFCLLYQCRLHLIPKTLVKYRIHEKQLSQVRLTKSFNQTNHIRKIVLNKLNFGQQEEYELALKQYQKNKPISERSRHAGRDFIFKLLPKSFSNRILKYYMSRKK